MTFQESIRTVYLDKYATFAGRAPRSEYWWSMLAFYLVLLVLLIPFLFMAEAGSTNGEPSTFFYIFLVLIGIVVLAAMIPLISVTVRRFHDMNLSGWIYLLLLLAGAIPMVGIVASIAQIVITVLKGTVGPNKFGDDPLIEATSEKVFE